MSASRSPVYRLVACLAVLTAGAAANAQTKPAAAAPGKAPSTLPATQTAPAAPISPEELEQLVAPIALYPDSLLAQVFMASTYPLEVVQADRWVKQNPKLKDSSDELNKLPWDPTVKSLLDFPQVLTMMSEKLDWTVKLGDAFLADRKAVMDAVQRLRRKAYDKGNLKTNGEQKVTVEDAPAPAAGVAAPPQSSQVIVVQPASPSVVYVPAYNPTVVYGAWPYPAYPPYSYPPAYTAGAAMLSFGVGVAVGAAWGNAWGNCNWHGGDVDIDVNRNANFNTNVNRNSNNQINNNRNNQINNNRGAGGAGNRGSFQHNPSHRQGVAYRDSATNDRYRGSGSSRTAAQSRDAYRGRAETGRQDLSRGSADSYRGSGGAGGAGSGRADARSTGGYRTSGSSGGSSARQSTGSSRNTSGTRSSGFSDSGSSSARAASSRGQSSRSSSSYGSSGRSGGGSSGGSRSGGSRGGGGGGGRGGGGGGRR